MIIEAEVELPAETAKRLEQFIEAECIDQDRWYKKALIIGVETLLKAWEIREARKETFRTRPPNRGKKPAKEQSNDS